MYVRTRKDSRTEREKNSIEICCMLHKQNLATHYDTFPKDVNARKFSTRPRILLRDRTNASVVFVGIIQRSKRSTDVRGIRNVKKITHGKKENALRRKNQHGSGCKQ